MFWPSKRLFRAVGGNAERVVYHLHGLILLFTSVSVAIPPAKHPNATMPLYPAYIPAKIADRALWYANFSSLLTATPIVFGLTAPDAVAVAAANSAFQASYVISSTPATRTTPAIAQTQLDDANAAAVIRPYAVRISKNASVSPMDKSAIGVTIPSTTPTPIPPPTTQPAVALASATDLEHVLQYYDTSTPTSKAKAAGSIGLEVWRVIATTPAIDPAQASYFGAVTKSPFRSTFVSADRGKQCTYFCRWVNRSGAGGVANVGPWSAPNAFGVI